MTLKKEKEIFTSELKRSILSFIFFSNGSSPTIQIPHTRNETTNEMRHYLTHC